MTTPTKNYLIHFRFRSGEPTEIAGQAYAMGESPTTVKTWPWTAQGCADAERWALANRAAMNDRASVHTLRLVDVRRGDITSRADDPQKYRYREARRKLSPAGVALFDEVTTVSANTGHSVKDLLTTARGRHPNINPGDIATVRKAFKDLGVKV